MRLTNWITSVTSVTSEQWLVLAVVNSSDWDTDDYMQSFNGLDKEMWKIKKLHL